MKSQDLIKHHQSDHSALEAEINKLEQELVNVKMQHKLGQVQNVHQVKTIRHNIARLKTIKRQKELIKETEKSQA